MSDDTMTSKYRTEALNKLHTKLSDELKRQKHYIYPYHNLHSKRDTINYDVENVAKIIEHYPYSCDLPKPLLPAAPLNRTVLSGVDPALQLLETKAFLNEELNRFKQCTTRYVYKDKAPSKKDIKYTTKSDGKTYCDVKGCIAKVAEWMDSDPDPYFSGLYNWYYTGGGLKHVTINSDDVLIFPFTSELVATPVVCKPNSIWKPMLKNGSKCSIDSTLYELKSCTVNDICFLMGRFKQQCIFYRLTNVKDKLELFEIHTQTSNVPLVSADIHHTNSNYFCTVNTERTICIWDLTKVKPSTSNKIKSRQKAFDNWAHLRYHKSDENVLIYTDRCCVQYLDIRMPLIKPALTLCPKSVLEKCEYLCLNVPSRNEHASYVGACHNFLLIDKRGKDCVQQKWTHMLKSPPLLADVCNRNDQEFLGISSQFPYENVVIVNTWTSEDESISKSLPYRLPSILKTISTAKTLGRCLDPMTKERLKLCNTGCSFLSNQNRLFYFVQNSIDDVFYQCITHDKNMDLNSADNIRALDALEQWEKSVLSKKNNIKPLIFNDKIDMQSVYDHLTNRQLKWEPVTYEKVLMGKWKQPLSKLSKYTDLLASDLLKMWEVSEDPEVPLSAAPHQKVLNWLGSSEPAATAEQYSQEFRLSHEPRTSRDINAFDEPHTSRDHHYDENEPQMSQESNIFSQVNTQELVSVSQTLPPEFEDKKDAVKHEELEDNDVMFLPTVTTKSRHKNSKRKRPQFAFGM